MNLYFKFLVLLLKRLFFRKEQKITDTCESVFRVGFWDLDLNFHMNNGKFLSVMDLGRFDLLLQTGYFYKIFRQGYYPVVFSESIVFKRSLNYLSKYQVRTKVESWDEQFFYITQRFFYQDKEVASANVRACFKRRGLKGLVKTKTLFSVMGEEFADTQMSELSKKQLELDALLLPRAKKTDTSSISSFASQES